MRRRSSHTQTALSSILSPSTPQDAASEGQEDLSLSLGQKTCCNEPALQAEQDKLVAHFADIALGDHGIEPAFLGTVVLMAQSLLGYEKELQRLEREMRSLRVEVDALRAIKCFEKKFNQAINQNSDVHPMMRETVSRHIGGGLDREYDDAAFAIEGQGVKQSIEAVTVRKDFMHKVQSNSCTNMKEWPLPPSRKSWEKAEERKRNR